MHHGNRRSAGARRTREYRQRLTDAGVQSVHLYYRDEVMPVLQKLCTQYDLSMSQMVNALILGHATPYRQRAGGANKKALRALKNNPPPIRPRKNSRMLKFGGKTKSMAEWSRETGIAYAVIQSRLRYGWSVASALQTPVTKPKGRKK
ncbi:MAG TPA: hypothetical protein VFM97_00495 [Gammaproteobacteria bacterium]|nr:hypothetical protein [Gammaproteobacteria bacterium]